MFQLNAGMTTHHHWCGPKPSRYNFATALLTPDIAGGFGSDSGRQLEHTPDRQTDGMTLPPSPASAFVFSPAGDYAKNRGIVFIRVALTAFRAPRFDLITDSVASRHRAAGHHHWRR